MLKLLIILIMLAINALLAGYELGITTVRLQRLMTLAEKKIRGAAAALHMKQNIEATLSTIQIGISLCGAVAAAMGGSESMELLKPYLLNNWNMVPIVADIIAVAAAVLPISILTITFAELVPKVLALKHAESICLKLSTPVMWFAKVVKPAIAMFEFLVRHTVGLVERFHRSAPVDERHETAALIHEIRALTTLSRTANALGRQEEKIIMGATRLNTTQVADIMLKPHEMTTMSSQSTFEDLVWLAHEEGHKRFPIATDPNDPNTITGYIAARELFYYEKTHPKHPEIKSIIRPLITVSQSMVASSLLEKMVSEDLHIMLVRNENNQITGMVTLEDILEELVGDIRNEYDRLPQHIQMHGKAYLVGGGAMLVRLVHDTDLAAHPRLASSLNSEWTVSDYITHKLGHAPQIGDKITLANAVLEVLKIKRQQTKEAILFFPDKERLLSRQPLTFNANANVSS